jgi:hypothetical protein
VDFHGRVDLLALAFIEVIMVGAIKPLVTSELAE